MVFISEREAENFLEKEEFIVVSRAFCSKISGIRRAIKKVGIPFVMKVSGSKIMEKEKRKGVKFGINNYSVALEEFSNLKKIKGAEGVLFQSKIEGNKYFVGINKTPEFGHIVSFGAFQEENSSERDIGFRVVPLTKEEAKFLIKETKISKGLLKPEGQAIEEVILKVSELAEKYPKISELQLHPLIVNKGKALIVDVKMKIE